MTSRRQCLAVLLAGLISLPAMTRGGAALAMSTADFLAGLSSEEARQLQAWKTARRTYEQRLDVYWEKVDTKRAERKRKRNSVQSFSPDDYIMSFPPTYGGPRLNDELAAKYTKFLANQDQKSPEPERELASVADYLAAAKRVYGFEPERVSEKEFKRRYAEEAHAAGLSKDQVVRVYALETGGIGTYDMQAGIHPIKKTGKPISSALGYAQLLDANSVNELALNGPHFIERLQQKAANPKISTERRVSLKRKIVVLKRMYANVKRIPFEWERHQSYAKTDPGMGIHVLNIDGDIGPILQANKLKGLMDLAAKKGRPNLSGAQIEVMNLSGPATGLELMQPAGLAAPVTNFFARRAYYVNKMVVGLTGEQLLAELDRRMNESMKSAGAVEFAAAFDAVVAAKTAGR